jgi:hypothetical protein
MSLPTRVRALLRTANLAAIVSLVACSGLSSGGGSAYGAGDPALAAAGPGESAIDPFLTNGAAVLRALDAIAAKSGKPLRVISMNADQVNGLTVHVQEPKAHVNVDEYAIGLDGTLTGPKPVQLMSENGKQITAAEVDAQAFDPKAVGFGRLAQTARQAIAKSNFPDARVTQWEFDGPNGRCFMYLQASRGRPAAVLGPHLAIESMSF